MQIPNLISLGRVLLVPVAIWLIVNDNRAGAFGVFVAAGISDAVDGFIAKRFGWQTELGAYLDPLADKLLLVSVFIALGIKGDLPSWLVIGVVTRDILIIAGVILAWVLTKPLRVRPTRLSKTNTLCQILLAGSVLAAGAFGLSIDPIRYALIGLTAFTTVASFGAYLVAWLNHMAGYNIDFQR